MFSAVYYNSCVLSNINGTIITNTYSSCLIATSRENEEEEEEEEEDKDNDDYEYDDKDEVDDDDRQ